MTVPVIPDLTLAPSAAALDAASVALVSCIGGFVGSVHYPGDIASDNFIVSGSGFEAEHFRESRSLCTIDLPQQDDWLGPLVFDVELLAIVLHYRLSDGGANDISLDTLKATPVVLGGGGLGFNTGGGAASWSNRTALSQLVLPYRIYRSGSFVWEAFGLLPAGSALQMRIDAATYIGGSPTSPLGWSIHGKVRLQPY